MNPKVSYLFVVEFMMINTGGYVSGNVKMAKRTELDNRVLFFVLTQIPQEYDDEFSQWYEETHIPLLMESGLLKGVVKYKLDCDSFTENQNPSYLVAYEFEDRESFELWKISEEKMVAHDEAENTWGRGFRARWGGVFLFQKRWEIPAR